MALAVGFTFTIRDIKGKTSVTRLHVPTGFSAAQYGEFAQAMGQIICDLNDGELIDVSFSVPLSLSGATIRATAGLAADVAKKALLVAGSAIAGLFARFNIPTYDESHNEAPETDAIDMADVEVAALVAILEGGAGASPCDMRGNNLTDVLSARETFRKFN